ncbi:MAG: F0F1 ATP synthase subunit A [Thermodesulfovibrionales bacterium]|jgi:F-type H+-transporting ATPase subunit a|nr:F0F1 ATP synthase subunit A [Thermodesulfovibrionales bacterium]
MEGLHEVLMMDAFINPAVIPHNVTHAFLVSILLIVAALTVKGSLRLVPRGFQNFMEVLIEQILKLADDTIGLKWSRSLFPFICTIFLFILVANLMGLIPGFMAATSNVNTNAAMAVPVFLMYNFYGIKVHGVHYLNHFLGPIRSLAGLPLMIMMFFIEIIGHFVRPITLTVRLFGNMTGKHILLLVLGIISPAVIPGVILGLGLLVSVVQALVFTLLTTCYFAGAVEEAH